MTILLGIESSCDETAAAVVADGREVLSNVVASQDELHVEFGGVVPEIASRAHLERVQPVIERSLANAGVSLRDIDAIAVANRPGLIGSLLVGVAAAKAIAWSCNIPIIGVDHVLAHLVAPSLDDAAIDYPAIGLVVSGGHTAVLALEDSLIALCLVRTIDDAAGEAFDKAAATLSLGYPGGPRIEAAAAHGSPVHRLPRPRSSEGFSFSGLKTALLYGVRGTPVRSGGHTVFERSHEDLSEQERADWAASFQEAAVDTVIAGLEHAMREDSTARCIVAGGGVLANARLRSRLEKMSARQGLPLRLPRKQYCLDNAAMVAAAGWHGLQAGTRDALDITASPRGAA